MIVVAKQKDVESADRFCLTFFTEIHVLHEKFYYLRILLFFTEQMLLSVMISSPMSLVLDLQIALEWYSAQKMHKYYVKFCQ